MASAPGNALKWDLRAASDVDFIALIALRRPTYDYEVWRNDGPRSAKIAIRSLNEYLLISAPSSSTVHPAFDVSLPPDGYILDRAYGLFLDRPPSADETRHWLSKPSIGIADLCRDLLESFESYEVDGLAEQLESGAFAFGRDVHYHTRVRDRHINTVAQKSDKTDYLRPVPLACQDGDEITVLITMNPGFFDRQAIIDELKACGISANIVTVNTDQLIDGAIFRGADLLFHRNDLLYDRQDAQLSSISRAGITTICWHIDNHHEFTLSGKLSETFDYIFPAHPGGYECMRGGKAVVGSVVPCGTGQWTPSQAARLYAEFGELERSPSLYGRFNSYPGRNAARDTFLREVSREVSDNVVVVDSGENNWFSRSLSDRFQEIAGYKAILCTPIYNDTPNRVFDALIAGAIPIVPYGTPGLGLSFDLSDPTVPLMQYLPGSVSSLRCALHSACIRFDEEGLNGARNRHNLALDKHMTEARISRILKEVVLNYSHI